METVKSTTGEYTGIPVPRWVKEGVRIRVKQTAWLRQHPIRIGNGPGDYAYAGDIGTIERWECRGRWNWDVVFRSASGNYHSRSSLSEDILKHCLRIQEQQPVDVAPSWDMSTFSFCAGSAQEHAGPSYQFNDPDRASGMRRAWDWARTSVCESGREACRITIRRYCIACRGRGEATAPIGRTRATETVKCPPCAGAGESEPEYDETVRREDFEALDAVRMVDVQCRTDERGFPLDGYIVRLNDNERYRTVKHLRVVVELAERIFDDCTSASEAAQSVYRRASVFAG